MARKASALVRVNSLLLLTALLLPQTALANQAEARAAALAANCQATTVQLTKAHIGESGDDVYTVSCSASGGAAGGTLIVRCRDQLCVVQKPRGTNKAQ